MITLTNLSARIAGRLLIENANLSLPAGTKAGLVGRNGAGKSTLFRIITGDMESESGSVSLPRNARIGQVAQEAPGTEEPLIDIVLKADVERTALLAEEQTTTDPHRIAEIHMRLADIDAHSMTEALRVHHAERRPDGTFAREDEILRVEDEPSHDELCRREQQVFLDAIHGRFDLEAHWTSATDSLRIVLAADQSAREGRTIHLR